MNLKQFFKITSDILKKNGFIKNIQKSNFKEITVKWKKKSLPFILVTFVHDVFSFHGSFKPGNIWFLARLTIRSQSENMSMVKANSPLSCIVRIFLSAEESLGMHRSENMCTSVMRGDRAGLTQGITPPVDYGSTWDSKKMDFFFGFSFAFLTERGLVISL